MTSKKKHPDNGSEELNIQAKMTKAPLGPALVALYALTCHVHVPREAARSHGAKTVQCAADRDM